MASWSSDYLLFKSFSYKNFSAGWIMSDASGQFFSPLHSKLSKPMYAFLTFLSASHSDHFLSGKPRWSISDSTTLDRVGLLYFVYQNCVQRTPIHHVQKVLKAGNYWMASLQEKQWFVWSMAFLFLNLSVLARNISKWRNRKTPEIVSVFPKGIIF